jgi:hypothetical protein
VPPLGHAIPPTPEPAPPKRSPAHYLWALLIAKIYEVFALVCPICGGQMRLIAFITEGTHIRRILDHIIEVGSESPHISPARGTTLWDDGGDAQVGDGARIETDWDQAAQPAPDFEADQRAKITRVIVWFDITSAGGYSALCGCKAYPSPLDTFF